MTKLHSRGISVGGYAIKMVDAVQWLAALSVIVIPSAAATSGPASGGRMADIFVLAFRAEKGTSDTS